MLKVERVPIDSVRVYAKNAKLHPAEQIEQIKKSIQDFGNNDPIAVWGKDSTIVEGHGRYIALKELGYEEVDIIRLDHLTDEQRRAYALVHNKLTMNSGFNFDLLQEELSNFSIDLSDFDLNLDDEPWTPVQGGNTAEPPKFEPQFTPDGVTTGEAGGDDPYLPETYDDSEIQEYIDKQEEFVVKKRIIITYLPEQEQELADFLHIEKIDKVVYDIDEVFE